jgi:hypothetical protein
LEDLTVVQMQCVLEHLSLAKCKVAFLANDVSGLVLAQCETIDEIKELGASIVAHAKVLLQKAHEWRRSGVPRSMLIPLHASSSGAFTGGSSSRASRADLLTVSSESKAPVDGDNDEPFVRFPPLSQSPSASVAHIDVADGASPEAPKDSVIENDASAGIWLD